MKPAVFEYVEVDSEDALLSALSRHGGDGRLLAGGQSLVPMMNFRLATPAVLIDINPIASLSHIDVDDDTLVIGALTRHAMLEDSRDVAVRCPLVRDAIKHVAHRAVRNRGTMGGSLALAYPGAEIPLILVTLGADITLNSPRGVRTLTADEFIIGALDTVIADDEYIRAAKIELPPPSAGAAFIEASRRHGDFALAAAAVVVDLDRAGRAISINAAISGGTGKPVRLSSLEKELTGRALNRSTFGALAGDAVATVEVFGDHHYPQDYREHLLRAVLSRALAEALDKAEQRHVQ